MNRGEIMIFDYMHDEGYDMMDGYWFGFGWIFMVLFWLGYIAISIAIAYFVHKDAVKRHLPNPEVWVLIVLIFNVIGLLVYLLARDNYRTEKDSPK